MPFTARHLSFLPLVAAFWAAIGCQSAAPSSPSDPIGISTTVQAAGYESEMAFNVELLTPDTGLPHHATMAELKPVVMREVHRLTQEPLLRQVLNKQSVQRTQWFKSFGGDLRAAQAALRKAISTQHVPDSSLIRCSIITPQRDEAQVILKALSDEYMRIKHLKAEATFSQQLEAAQQGLNRAEEKIMAMRVMSKRFLGTTPIDTLHEQASENAIQVRDLSESLNEWKRKSVTTQAEYHHYLQREREGNFDPSDSERIKINQSERLQAIDHRLIDLRLEEAGLQSEKDPEKTEIKRIEALILALERLRKAEFDRQARELYLGAVEQAALELEALHMHIASTTESLKKWTAKRQDQFGHAHQYKTLQRELRALELEKNRAQRRVNDLITQAKAGTNGLSYRVNIEYPAQVSRQRASEQ